MIFRRNAIIGYSHRRLVTYWPTLRFNQFLDDDMTLLEQAMSKPSVPLIGQITIISRPARQPRIQTCASK
jgi:hypothetical protein